jgi:signal transduction histidine kinase
MLVPRSKWLKKIDVSPLIALIIAAVGILGFMQYSWFRAAASTELADERRSLESSAVQAASREYQRYATLLGDLRSLGAKALSGRAQAELLLERAYAAYGPSGSEPHLISSVGLASRPSSSTIVSLGASGSWAPAPSPLQGLPLGALDLAEGELALKRGAAGQASLLLAPLAAGGLAVVELDDEGFFARYVEPAVAGILHKASIEWRQDLGPRPDDPAVEGRERGFAPLAALFKKSGERLDAFDIRVPASLGSPPLPGQPIPPPVARGDPQLRPVREADMKARGSAFMRGRVVMPADSGLGVIERRLSLYWLFGALLLIAIGLALVLALLQVKRLRAVNEKEREFVASITHELRTPVTAIQSAADNMRRGLVGVDRMAPYGEMIHAQVLRLGGMIEEVLMFAQVESDAVPGPRLAPVSPEALEDELRPPLEAIAKAEGIGLSWDFGALPVEFLGEAESLRLILSNLAANALYHAYAGTEPGELRVIGEVVGQAAGPATIRFVVEDDGRGIARGERELVFEPFYRSEASRERREKGSGLGLFIARRKARRLGGDIRLESPYAGADGKRRPGCRFTLELPLKEKDDAR